MCIRLLHTFPTPLLGRPAVVEGVVGDDFACRRGGHPFATSAARRNKETVSGGSTLPFTYDRPATMIESGRTTIKEPRDDVY
jgi:hypothetical protein